MRSKMQETMLDTQATIDNLAVVNKILEANNNDQARLIPILQAIQDEYNYLSRDVIRYVAAAIGVPPSQVYGVATFYAHFSLEPKGKYIIKLCDGTACHVKKSHGILNALFDRLKLSAEKRTSADGLFTLETVSCLGACGLAPVMVVNGEVHGQVTPEKALEIINSIVELEKSK
ncbi:MAG: NAD(P)H-dependent oxidoreductase subunit E [Lentisphaeria bacterium]|nr:NAD(P)H-dependent oxidoreductase subunit E [Lentisphaeria bacterium]